MDDFRLRVFITAAKTLNFTKCAEQLFISQPAVSKHIGELESRYKVQLFERSGSRLALTEAGRVMLEHAERIADGYYYAKSVRLFKYLLEHPALLERPMSEEVDYE